MKRREFLQSVAAACGLAALPVGGAVLAGPRLTASEVPYPYERANAARRIAIHARINARSLRRLQREWERIDATLAAYVPGDDSQSIIIPFSEQVLERAQA